MDFSNHVDSLKVTFLALRNQLAFVVGGRADVKCAESEFTLLKKRSSQASWIPCILGTPFPRSALFLEESMSEAFNTAQEYKGIVNFSTHISRPLVTTAGGATGDARPAVDREMGLLP